METTSCSGCRCGASRRCRLPSAAGVPRQPTGMWSCAICLSEHNTGAIVPVRLVFSEPEPNSEPEHRQSSLNCTALPAQSSALLLPPHVCEFLFISSMLHSL